MHAKIEKIIQYWRKRADSYSQENIEELAGSSTSFWLRELEQLLPNKKNIKILDIGTGPGFLAIVLSKAGYDVTGIDCTDTMLEEARHNAKQYHVSIAFKNQKAEMLDYQDESIDVIVNRNLTWNLVDPKLAYAEWYRVLKPSGKLIIFDANWYHYLYSDSLRKAYEDDRENVKQAKIFDHNIGDNFEQMENIAKELPMTLYQRPSWDMHALKEVGFQDVTYDTQVFQRVWTREEKINYASTPLFEIVAVK